jgi:hypothetical protein
MMNGSLIQCAFRVLLASFAVVSVSGAAQYDLKVSITCPSSLFKAGDTIPITFEIANVGNIAYRYADRSYDNSGRMPEYELSAADDAGRAVPDPREQATGMGGISDEAVLAPGATFKRTIDLNSWALIATPGKYVVNGVYHPEILYRTLDPLSIRSQPIVIEIQHRTDSEMAAYIDEAARELAASGSEEVRRGLVHRLAYTCDPRAVPPLLDAVYVRDNMSPIAGADLYFHMPRQLEVKGLVIDAATRRGLGPFMLNVLKKQQASAAQTKNVIQVSLSAEMPSAWADGALAASEYPDDAFTKRLAEIALNEKSPVRREAVHALAANRTDESVAALKALLADGSRPYGANAPTMAQLAGEAVKTTYWLQGSGSGPTGRPFRNDDFPLEFQNQKPPFNTR